MYDPAELNLLLAASGWTRRELARRLGRNPLVVQRWCTGLSVPDPASLAWLRSLVAWLHVNPPPSVAPPKMPSRFPDFRVWLASADPTLASLGATFAPDLKHPSDWNAVLRSLTRRNASAAQMDRAAHAWRSYVRERNRTTGHESATAGADPMDADVPPCGAEYDGT